jgi:ubiquinone/menaquinone biosynthesis C-methylase UbiE
VNELLVKLICRLKSTKHVYNRGERAEKLVQRVNELYHDFTNLQYTRSHPEIFMQERKRWEKNAELFLSFTNPITIIDVGTGTGFVPLVIAKFLKREDLFICSDISEGMLDVAKQNIDKQRVPCKFRFIKIESNVPFRLPFETSSADIVTMNSVLHHVNDTSTFLKEVDRVLKSNGLLFIGHEPNRYFYENRLLCGIRSILVRANYSAHNVREKDSSLHHRICREVNYVLSKEKLISSPLTVRDIERIVDVKSEEGFKPDLLLSNCKLVNVETYSHLFGVTLNGNFIEKCDDWLRRRFPNHGRLFFAVLKKGFV